EEEDDDTEELLRELEKIKKERAEEKERQERENMELQEQKRQEEIATGNPLLHKDFSVKRSIGLALTESLDELIQAGKITPQLAMKVLVQ
ncbi:299_t:CDS:2, partial [Ambispora leptoticha]